MSLGGRTRVIADMARIAPVYTPPQHRRQGFGTAVTASLTQTALDAGAREIASDEIEAADLTAEPADPAERMSGYSLLLPTAVLNEVACDHGRGVPAPQGVMIHRRRQ